MVRVTLLGTQRQEIFINPHQIEYIENDKHNPTLVMLSGKRLRVMETLETVIKRIILYRRNIGIFKNEI
ncbi:flagellar FlbD family protein [Candidatus Haliotispira prima]|uniref:Flagellar FlbD family protein n=1 Tax=Candidatus Haliotispira prima TaxID=3034016 RepID=A0ABY8MG97_9SPIO|nr:flagellar FlbD family protein [Candidatus Haliotispira prima]